ncbi:hypothetical protein OG762_48785 (plasmid) [Streptomyces sp. NBC_01136]|uniref:hypothetical protein n=1 Tax=unclassified Streptomyces TaxID=2593676 RepID=UPI002F90ECDE|nr:hypothetical protein OG762_48785 [Streptomyces sp. NBC_01136]
MSSATTTQTSAEETTTTTDIVARMVDLYPGWENRRTLRHSANAALDRKAGQQQPSNTGAARRSRPPASPLEP